MVRASCKCWSGCAWQQLTSACNAFADEAKQTEKGCLKQTQNPIKPLSPKPLEPESLKLQIAKPTLKP